MKKTISGFTIVELLIVIVVVAILAAISIIAYNGIQARTNNTARIANATSAIKLVKLYKATYDKYPLEINFNSCIGDGFPDDKCWGVTSATPSLRSVTLNDTELKKVGSLPKNVTPVVKTSAWDAAGPVYWYNPTRTVDGQIRPLAIIYFLQGASQDCGSDNIIRESTSNVFATYSGSPRFSSNLGDATVCYVALD